MNNPLQSDNQQLDSLLEEVKQIASRYLQNIHNSPSCMSEVSAPALALPVAGTGAQAALKIFTEQIQPLLVAASGPRYFGFVTGGGTPAAILGDWLVSVFDQNTQYTHGRGDASALVEQQTVQMLLDLFGLPGDFYGGFVTGATMSNFSCLAVARQWLGQQYQKNAAREGLGFPLKIYAAVPHSSSTKALGMLGIGSSQVELVPCLPGRESMDMQAFERLLEAAPLSAAPTAPFILISSGGTVNTVDYDDMAAIARLKSRYSFWWHIDAAFGAFAACSPTYKHLLTGWDGADSITVDCHKWLNVPYDSALYFSRKEHASLQIHTFQNTNAPYLGDPMENFSYANFGPENSRRFRALPAWFTLIAYGRQGYQEIVERNIALARRMGQLLEETGLFVLASPVRLNVVCFTLSADKGRSENISKLLQKLYESGRVFITPSQYAGTPCLRAALVNWRTQEEDILLTVQELISAYKSLS